MQIGNRSLLQLETLFQDKFPSLPVLSIFYRFYPYKLFLGKEGKNAVEDILQTFGVLDDSLKSDENSKIKKVKILDNNAEITIDSNGGEATLQVRNVLFEQICFSHFYYIIFFHFLFQLFRFQQVLVNLKTQMNGMLIPITKIL